MAYDFSSLTDKLEKALTHVQQDISTLRTGKATPQLLDSVMVEAYGSKLRIAEVASVTAPDTTLLTVTPWDKNILTEVEKGILQAQLNLNPVINGDSIRIVVPALTEERRKEMVKVLKQKIETGRVMLRTVRTDTKKDIEKQKGTDGVSEDDISSQLEKLDSMLKSYTDRLDEMEKNKAADLMTV
jgi:ribosome recycling factor